MSTQQPVWHCVGNIGHVDPIAHGGGYVYTDGRGIYGTVMTWFDRASDEAGHKTGGATKLRIYRVSLDTRPEAAWWWNDLKTVASSVGEKLETFQAMIKSENPLKRATVYAELIRYYGPNKFDDYPVEMTEAEAHVRYSEEPKTLLRLAFEAISYATSGAELFSQLLDAQLDAANKRIAELEEVERELLRKLAQVDQQQNNISH